MSNAFYQKIFIFMYFSFELTLFFFIWILLHILLQSEHIIVPMNHVFFLWFFFEFKVFKINHYLCYAQIIQVIIWWGDILCNINRSGQNDFTIWNIWNCKMNKFGYFWFIFAQTVRLLWRRKKLFFIHGSVLLLSAYRVTLHNYRGAYRKNEQL